MKTTISAILVAGGKGTRLGGSIPKQFKPLRGKSLALYSLDFFNTLEEIEEIIVVCNPIYQSLFTSQKPLRFTHPGNRRQDSVYHGLQASSANHFVCIHDTARPFLDKQAVLELFEKAFLCGAAALATPLVNTIKRADALQNVCETLPRSSLWEIQTPQVIERNLLFKAYAHAKKHGIEATDDLSLIEAIGAPAALVKGSPQNFKITTPFDWIVAEALCAASN